MAKFSLCFGAQSKMGRVWLCVNYVPRRRIEKKNDKERPSAKRPAEGSVPV